MNKKINLPDDFSEIHLIPYMHTDYSWTNSRPWHIRRYTCGLGRALEIMRTDPDFTYVIDNVHHSFSVFEKYCPELMPEFEERVKEGRLVIANGGYSLARPDYCGEEAYVRNIVGGQRYFRSRFDIPDGESHFFFNADTGIGHSQLPQILRLTGNRYYRSNRPSETMNRKGIPRQFVWQGLDGSRIIVARGDYGGLFVTDWLDRNPDIDKGWQEILDGYWGAEQNNACNSASDKLMLFFGCDDVIPGCNLIDRPVPYREFIAGWNRKQRGKMMLSTPGRYFGRLESEKDTLPVVDGVLDNCELSYNIPYKGQNSMWYRRRVLERLILRLEYMRSMLNGLGYQCGYDDVGELWVDMMSISGHALEYVLTGDIERLEEQGDEAILRCRRLIREAEETLAMLRSTGNGSDARVTEYTVINPIPEERCENVAIHVTSAHGIDGLSLTDADGNEVPYQITEVYTADKAYECECNSVDVLARVKLPAAGYTTVTARPTGEKLKYDRADLDDYDYVRKPGNDPAPVVVDTGEVKATFESGRLTAVEYRGKRITGDFGALKFSEFRPKSIGWAAIWGDAEEFDFEPREWGLVRNGDLRSVYRVKGRLRTADATVEITLETGSPRIDFRVTLDCERNEGIFTASFPCDSDTELYADVPYGVEKRDLSCEPSENVQGNIGNPEHYFYWESAWRGQFWARNFALFTGNRVNTALISDTCAIYYSLRRDLGTVSLLLTGQLDLTEKSERKTDSWVRLGSPSYMGLGKSTYRFSYCPLPDEPKEKLFADAARETKLLHFRPVSAPVYRQRGGTLPAKASVLSHSGADAVITASYSENGERVVRGYEASGLSGRVVLEIAGNIGSAYKADLMGERIGDDVTVNGNRCGFDVRPWEIFTVRLKQPD